MPIVAVFSRTPDIGIPTERPGSYTFPGHQFGLVDLFHFGGHRESIGKIGQRRVFVIGRIQKQRAALIDRKFQPVFGRQGFAILPTGQQFGVQLVDQEIPRPPKPAVSICHPIADHHCRAFIGCIPQQIAVRSDHIKIRAARCTCAAGTGTSRQQHSFGLTSVEHNIVDGQHGL